MAGLYNISQAVTINKLEEEAKKLLCKINKVTSNHRHSIKITKKSLDNLCNAQLDFEVKLKEIIKDAKNDM